MIHRLVVTGLVLAGLSSTVLASNGRNPGSLLLYPEFDNRLGTVTVLTVTNIDTDENNDAIDVEFVYVGRFNGIDNNDAFCLENNRTQTLTPADTFTCITDIHNPNQDWGYAFVFAKEVDGDAIVHNFLTGNVITVDGVLTSFEYSVNAVSYKGINADNGDGDLLLDGVEYSGTASDILIPRFFGQNGIRKSDLVLIGLSGGPNAYTTVDLLIWNDNEEIFSSEHTFRCWRRIALADISPIFNNDYLATFTNDDPDELQGHPSIETGWLYVTGAIYSVNNQSFPDPSVYAVLIERVGATAAGSLGLADLPFESGIERLNGKLHSVTAP